MQHTTTPEAWERVRASGRDLDAVETLLDALSRVPGQDQGMWASALQGLRDLRWLHARGCPVAVRPGEWGPVVRLRQDMGRPGTMTCEEDAI